MSDDLLNAQAGIGAYRWGSLLLETSSLAPVNGRAIIRALAGAGVDGFVAESDAQQRAMIAVLHELVHLQQDLATGLGAWDHLVDRLVYPRLVTQTHRLVTKFDEPPYADVVKRMLDMHGSSDIARQVRDDLEAIHTRTVGQRQLRGGEWATPEVQAALERRVNYGVEAVRSKSLRMMIEGEAACIVHRQIVRSRTNADGLEWLDMHRDLWNVLYKSDYLTPVIDVATVWLNHIPSDDEWLTGKELYIALVPWVIDLASAYPPPSLLMEWPGDPADFDPVLRYLLILKALNELDTDKGEQLLVAVSNGQWGVAEAVLRESSDLPYPSSVEIYERWLVELNVLSTSDDWDAPLFELRTKALQARLNGLAVKGIEAVESATLPVQVLVHGVGIQGTAFTNQLFGHSNLLGAMLARHSDMELYNLFYGTGRFRCPYGRANICDAQQKHCLTGIRVIDQLPVKGCQIRDELKGLGYEI